MLFVCAKEGKYVAKIENNGVVEENEETEEDGKGIPRKRARGCSTVKCGCKAHLLIKYDKWSSKWKVTVFTDAHNHPLVTPSKRMRMKSNRHMPKAVKNLTKAFHKENLGIFKVTSIFGGEHIGFDNRDCYNHLRNENGLESNEWLQQLYDIRESWVSVYNRGTFFAGMNTTRRSEGVNSFFDGFVTSTTNLKEFVVKDDQALKRIVKRENDEDFESEHKFRIVNDNEFLLKHGAKIYTRNVFNKFNDEMSGVFHYKVEEVGNANGIQSFIVKSKEHEVKKFEVPLDLQTYMGVCECQNFEFVGILCTHILKVFVRLDIDAIPDHFILPRWRQKANKFRIIDSEGLVHDDGKEESEALRLGHMCQESTKLACLAAPSNEAYMIYIEAMNDLSKKLLKVPKNTPNLNLIVLDPILMI
ncbi:hypothetical protein RHGRI_007884 [Rhododendron griersonianum]|uniref:Protein FAR1-RELATED SEQUENCE n=1 Tax=Rhododendron griersonianum TaxID=479676 RepID=A0AAV6L0A8_9ERIC|nr:hypothetical protein RHGRI_007884 [Rhododendron griersonianum]